MKKLLPFLLLFTFTACKQFVPSKDNTQLNALTDAQAAADLMYSQMSQGNRNYVTYADQYQIISNDLDSITSHDIKRHGAWALIIQDNNIVKVFAGQRGFHQGKGTLTPKQVTNTQGIIHDVIDTRIKSENLLKP